MNILVDTNILIYAINDQSPHHTVCRKYVDNLRSKQGFCVTWSVLYEFMRVITHPRVFDRPLTSDAALTIVQTFVNSPEIEVICETERHGNFLITVMDSLPGVRGNFFHDVHIATLMQEHGIRTIVTADRHFRLFPDLKIIDPTS